MIFASTAIAALGMLGVGAQGGMDQLEAGLLKVGSKLPDVSVTHPGGKTVKLSALYSGKKATIVNFWFYH